MFLKNVPLHSFASVVVSVCVRPCECYSQEEDSTEFIGNRGSYKKTGLRVNPKSFIWLVQSLGFLAF